MTTSDQRDTAHLRLSIITNPFRSAVLPRLLDRQSSSFITGRALDRSWPSVSRPEKWWRDDPCPSSTHVQQHRDHETGIELSKTRVTIHVLRYCQYR
jgi:hypothetical protein